MKLCLSQGYVLKFAVSKKQRSSIRLCGCAAADLCFSGKHAARLFFFGGVGNRPLDEKWSSLYLVSLSRSLAYA